VTDNPTLLQHRASDAAYSLCQDYPDRLTVAQRIQMEVTCLVAPRRLSVDRCGEAIATYCAAVAARR
jgi:hypothetical protein